MRNKSENGITSAADVIPAVADYIGRYGKQEFTQAPVVVQEMYNDLMDTPYGDDGSYRGRCLAVLCMIQDFADTVEPFSEEDIMNAVNACSHE